ncbi:MAG: hypothetical protein AB7N76_29790 [Planctomycetota bacterium]
MTSHLARPLLVLGVALALCGCPNKAPSPPPSPSPSQAPDDDGDKSEDHKTAKKSGTPKATPKADEARRLRRTYELKLDLSGPGLAQSGTQLLDMTVNPQGTGERLAIAVAGGGGLEMQLDARGEITSVSDETLRLMIQTVIELPGLKPREAPRNLYLPDGGWLRQMHQVKELSEPRAFGEDERPCLGTRVEAKYMGERASGEAFKGELTLELWRDQATNELLAERAKLVMRFQDHGPRKLTVSLLPKGRPASDPGPQSGWVIGVLKDALSRELGLPLIGTLLQASAIGTAAKVSPKMWGEVALMTAAVGALGAQVQALTGQPDSGKVVGKREEPARTLLTYLPTSRGPNKIELVPTAIADGPDHVIQIESGGRKRGIYVAPEAYAKLKEGQPFDVGAALAIDDHARTPATSDQATQLEGADDQKKAVIELP